MSSLDGNITTPNCVAAGGGDAPEWFVNPQPIDQVQTIEMQASYLHDCTNVQICDRSLSGTALGFGSLTSAIVCCVADAQFRPKFFRLVLVLHCKDVLTHLSS